LQAFGRNAAPSYGDKLWASARSGKVFEVAFDAVHRSTRHKSGVAPRFPRINRIRWDKPAREADGLTALAKWLA